MKLLFRAVSMPRPTVSTLAAISVLLACISARAQLPQDFERACHKLVDEVLVPSGVSDPRVIQAMKGTPRHEFLATKELRAKAYFDISLPIGEHQTISSPLIVAQMTQALLP